MKAFVVVGSLVLGLAKAGAQPASRAEVLYSEGQAAYDRGDFETAVARWQTSYELSKEPALLFNLAQAYRQRGRCRDALATYRRFVELDPTSAQRVLAEDFVRELAPACENLSTTPPNAPKTPSPHQPPVFASASSTEPPAAEHGRVEGLAGIATGATGVAMLVGGVVLGRRAATLGAEVTDACAISCDWETEREHDAAGRRDARLGHVLDAVGVAGIVGGMVLYYLGARDSHLGVTPTTAAHERGAVLNWSLTW